jgi:hypothetical protein
MDTPAPKYLFQPWEDAFKTFFNRIYIKGHTHKGQNSNDPGYTSHDAYAKLTEDLTEPVVSPGNTEDRDPHHGMWNNNRQVNNALHQPFCRRSPFGQQICKACPEDKGDKDGSPAV